MFQLSFLNSSLLMFATATILPLVIWLLAKKKPPQIVFSSLKFIKLSEEQKKNRTKITNIILLIIRMLIILLIVLAVSRPMFSSSRAGKSKNHPPTAIAIILDTSYSMDCVHEGKSLLDRAKEAVNEIGKHTNDSDRLILVTRDSDWNALYSQIYAKSVPNDVLDPIKFCYQPISWEDVFRFAERKLSEAQMPNKEIYLISDFVNEEIKVKTPIPILSIPITSSYDRENISLTNARILPQLVSRSKLHTAQFTLNNHGTEDRSDVLVKAVVGDVKIAEKFVHVPARQSITENITFELHSEGWQAGYIEVMDDFIEADNRSFFSFEYFRHPKVGIVSNNSLPPFLSSILRVYTGGVEPEIISPELINLAKLEDYSFLVFYDFGEINPKLREVFSAMKTKEIGSLFCLGRQLPADTKSYLEQVFGLSIKGYSQKTRSIDYISNHHKVSSMIADKNLKYNTISAMWETSGAVSSLISAQGYPLAIMSATQALWLWDSSNVDNSFFIDPAFPVFAFRQFNALQSTNVPMQEMQVGDAIRATGLTLPNGQTINLTNPNYFTKEPGLYTVNPGSPRQASVAVNMEYSDSDVKYTKPQTKMRFLGKDWIDNIFISRLGRDLWKVLLAIATILVILEIIIVKVQEAKPNS